MELLENLKWRYATKKYDASKKVSEEDINKIKEAIQLSASSYGLQLYKVLDIKSAEVREKLKPATWNQPQTTDASHLMVFCVPSSLEDIMIDSFVELRAKTQGVEVDALKGYGDFIKGKMSERSSEDKENWMIKQVYIALGNALAAAAELKVDSTPMEGFEAEAYGEILGLSDHGLKAAVVLALGYRSVEDATQNAPKVRRATEDLFQEV
ncbi:MAG: NAD(P)H-dependent oxidoreductase [Crocinitomicaceae bacterium]|nr:NAD(P)H-dependent oxidoreductase [Crocinitomicaceae bacterium]